MLALVALITEIGRAWVFLGVLLVQLKAAGATRVPLVVESAEALFGLLYVLFSGLRLWFWHGRHLLHVVLDDLLHVLRAHDVARASKPAAEVDEL